MANLDNLDSIKNLDRENILGNIQELPDQIDQCWEDWQNIALPTHYINAKNILILGMGGSGIGGSLVSSLADLSSNIPIFVLRDYNIPSWVDRNTLVIGVSYSGNTEETLSAFSEAAEKTEKLITISTGNKLASLGSRYGAVHYKINYGSQPRAALGYSFTSLVAILAKLRLIDISDESIEETTLLLRGLIKKIDADVPTPRNHAKLLAQKLSGKIPVIYGSGTLAEVARRWKGQFNENSKNTSWFEFLPELNHMSLVGLEYPSDLGKKIFVLILESKYDHPRNKLRQQITTQILQQRRIPFETIMVHPTGNILAEMIQVISLGDFVSYYLAILNNVAPEPVDTINYLKGKLAEAPLEGK